MPLYQIRCPGCGRADSIFRKVEERDSVPNCPCGWLMRREISAPMLAPLHFEPFESPRTPGKFITSQTELREELASTGCFLNEPGVRKDIERNRADSIEKAHQRTDEIIDTIVRDFNNAGKLDHA